MTQEYGCLKEKPEGSYILSQCNYSEELEIKVKIEIQNGKW